MFARPSPGAFICLRCQSRLLRRKRIFTPPVTALPRKFTTIHPRASASDYDEEERAPIRSTNGSEEYEESSKRELGQEELQFIADTGPRIKLRFDHKPDRNILKSLLGKVRGRRGGEVREGSASLSIKSLGEPAEVIILRDAGFEHKEREEEDEENESLANSESGKQQLSQESILRSIEDEKVELDQKVINEQIDLLRPKAKPAASRVFNAVLSPNEYSSLREELLKRYSSKQLRLYAGMARVRRDQERLKDTTSISLQWSPWTAGRTPIYRRPTTSLVKPSRMENIVSPVNKDKGKEALIDAIVRSYWAFDVAEEAENVVGELEIRVSPLEMQIFTAGNPSYVMAIGDKQQARIDVYREQNIIRITGDKITALQTLEEFDDIRSTIVFKSFLPSSTTGYGKFKPPPTKDLSYIANLTRTAITYTSQGKGYFNILGTSSDQIQDAKRAIQSIMTNSTDTISSFQGESRQNGIVTKQVAVLDGLPYSDRGGLYGRASRAAERVNPGKHSLNEDFVMKPTEEIVGQIATSLSTDSSSGDTIKERKVEYETLQARFNRRKSERSKNLKEQIENMTAAKNIEIEVAERLRNLIEVGEVNSAKDLLEDLVTRTNLDAAQKQKSDTGEAGLGERDSQTALSGVEHTAEDACENCTATGSSMSEILEISKEPIHPYIWSPQTDINITATLGQVLYPIEVSAISKTPPKKFRKTKFLRVVPNFAQVLPRLSECPKDSKVQDTLSFSLLKETWDKAGNKARYKVPEIRMEFKVSPLEQEPRTAEFSRMYAILNRVVRHTTLPSRAVDVCFTKETTVAMNLEGTRENEEIRTFIEQTKKNIIGGDRLRAPPSLRVLLPGWMLAARAETEDALHALFGHYYFAGVEHIEVVPFDYEGHALLYNSVEAGKIGGHYGELVLQGQKLGGQQLSEKMESKDAKDFVKKAFGLVEMVDTAVRGDLGTASSQIKMDAELGKEGFSGVKEKKKAGGGGGGGGRKKIGKDTAKKNRIIEAKPKKRKPGVAMEKELNDKKGLVEGRKKYSVREERRHAANKEKRLATDEERRHDPTKEKRIAATMEKKTKVRKPQRLVAERRKHDEIRKEQRHLGTMEDGLSTGSSMGFLMGDHEEEEEKKEQRAAASG